MYWSEAPLTAGQMLRVFHREEPYLFLGAAFTTVGLVAAAFVLLGRKFNALLIWFGLFAFLYGQRLWLQSPLLGLLVPSSAFFDRLRESSNYVVPIPAFLYFAQAGFLGIRGSRLAYGAIIIFLGLLTGTVMLGPLPAFHFVNNVVIIAALSILMIRWGMWTGADREFVVARRGMFAFVVCALCDNIGAFFRLHWKVEPFGFAVLLGTLGYIAARRTLYRDQQLGEIQKELEVARRIQMSILPASYPDSGCFRMGARYVPMTSVAGDFYDFLVAEEEQAGILIADVSGHGVPAALIASMVKLAATAQRASAADPAALLSGMNAALCGNTQNQFVTAAYVYLDAATRTLRYAAAAHPPMLLLRDGAVLEIVENGLMLAAFSSASYTNGAHALHLGDRIVLYTDGILEAANAQRDEFGRDRLHAAIRENVRTSPQQMADRIIGLVKAWSTSQDDDLTVLVCDYVGAG